MNPHPTARWKEPELRAIICYTAAAHMRTLDWNWHSLPTFESLGECSFMDIYQILALALDENGRALFFSLVVDRLRYPCLETYYFFMVLARLFTTLKNQIVKVFHHECSWKAIIMKLGMQCLGCNSNGFFCFRNS